MSYKNLFYLNHKSEIDRIIRVNHSGEIGALGIYKGQICSSKIRKYNKDFLSSLCDMFEGEIEHFDYFNKNFNKFNSRPSVFVPLWRKISFTMGFLSAVFNKNYAMVCTEAVEIIIERHYQDQLDLLKEMGISGDLYNRIQKFMLDEAEHKNTAHEYLKNKNYSLMLNMFMFITFFAIYIAKNF